MNPRLNTPEARQGVLRTRVAEGRQLVLSQLAKEFGVSPDTIRRDLLALEAEGTVQRVRGGALPVLSPSVPVSERRRNTAEVADRLAGAALDFIEDGMVLMLDGGTSVARLARRLPLLPRGLIVTPAPQVALETLARGTETILVGGRLSRFGGTAIGQGAVQAIGDIAADLCVLGACGLDAEFGLAADDPEEAAVKRAMLAASGRCAVLAGAQKLGRRARHRVCRAEEIDFLVTDAIAGETGAFAQTGMEIRHA